MNIPNKQHNSKDCLQPPDHLAFLRWFFRIGGTGMKRFLFVFALCVCSSANAATMCAPDLSTCESCTDGTYSGVSWTATCCGVTVSGIGVNIGMYSLYHMFCKNFSYGNTRFTDGGDQGACTCIMQEPVVAQFWPMIYYGTISGIDSGISYDSCAQACAENFYPPKAFSSGPFGEKIPNCSIEEPSDY